MLLNPKGSLVQMYHLTARTTGFRWPNAPEIREKLAKGG